VIFEPGSKLKEIGNGSFSESGIRSVRIPSNVEKIGSSCFAECKLLSELLFESGSKLKTIDYIAFFGCPLMSVKLQHGFTVDYKWPEGCRIDYFRDSAACEGTRKLKICGHAIDLDEEYEFVEGIGDSGEVELWRKIKSGEDVAVKSYSAVRVESDDAEKIFLREVEALVSLKHPCIVSLKGYCLPSDGHGPKIVTEYYGNDCLRRTLGAGSKAPRWWTTGRKIGAILGIVLGMKYFHYQGFIHRDLKPETIFIDNDGRIRIGDFWSSRLFEAGVTMTSVDRSTPLYLAPEAGDGDYDSKVDVYSFGLILYEIVSGDPTFSSSSGNKPRLLRQLQSGWRPAIKGNIRPLSRSLIERCWSMKANKRPSFAEIWGEIHRSGFDLIAGGKKADADAFLKWVESQGGEVASRK
jgi:serine/threonine protein kinase